MKILSILNYSYLPKDQEQSLLDFQYKSQDKSLLYNHVSSKIAQYQQQGGYIGASGQPQMVRTIIGTEEMKEIIYVLNKPPFNEQFSLVSFDDLSQLDLLELLNKVLVHLDKEEHGGINIKDEYQQATSNRICHFLKVLQYPSKYDSEFEQGLVQGQKQMIHPILHYILTRLPEMEKKSKIWKYLVPLDIPEEYLNEEDMKALNDEYKDQQAQYQVAHQNLEAARVEMMQPNELKKELTQLEQEKEQLNNKIRSFQQKNPGKKEFQDLLEVTNLLRREQEEEARIAEKIRQQKQYFEQNDQQQLQSQQRLLDAKKMVSADNSPEQMLYALRGEVKKNRELCSDRFQMEIMNKRKKIEQIEYLLNAPSVSSDDVINLENNLILLQNTIQQYEDRLRVEANPQDDKLAIYKQQAQLVAKKKDKLLEELKTLEEEEHQLEQEIQKKEEMMQRIKGPGYKSKDDFKQYAANLRDKTAKFKKMKEELKELTSELTILQRTETILHQNQESTSNSLKQKEEAKGILGCMQAKTDIQDISEKKQEIDQSKQTVLLEISKIVTEIQQKMKAKKAKLTPQVQKYKDLEENYNKVEMEYKTKKAQYEQITAGIESENTVLANELKKIRNDVYGEDTKAELMKYKSQILELKQKMLTDEGDYLAGRKQLNPQVKSYKEYFSTKIAKQDQELKEVKSQRNVIKETHEPNQRQMQMFKDLDQFLQLKLQVLQNQNMSAGMQRGEQTGNVNRLVLN